MEAFRFQRSIQCFRVKFFGDRHDSSASEQVAGSPAKVPLIAKFSLKYRKNFSLFVDFPGSLFFKNCRSTLDQLKAIRRFCLLLAYSSIRNVEVADKKISELLIRSGDWLRTTSRHGRPVLVVIFHSLPAVAGKTRTCLSRRLLL